MRYDTMLKYFTAADLLSAESVEMELAGIVEKTQRAKDLMAEAERLDKEIHQVNRQIADLNGRTIAELSQRMAAPDVL